MEKVVITSGYFNPLHIGHIDLMREAKKLGNILVVIVNNDEQVKIKGSLPFMPEQERVEIIKALKYPDKVVMSIDKDRSVAKSLRMVAELCPGELIFAKGGDRNTDNIPESERLACKELMIKIVDGVGNKIQSSSWLLNNVVKLKKK